MTGRKRTGASSLQVPSIGRLRLIDGERRHACTPVNPGLGRDERSRGLAVACAIAGFAISACSQPPSERKLHHPGGRDEPDHPAFAVAEPDCNAAIFGFHILRRFRSAADGKHELRRWRIDDPHVLRPDDANLRRSVIVHDEVRVAFSPDRGCFHAPPTRRVT